MKKLCVCLLMALLLCGCSGEDSFETISDNLQPQQEAKKLQMVVQLPDEVAVPVLSQPEEGKLYVCEDYTLTMHTYPAGDTQKVIKEISGYAPDALDIMKSKVGIFDRLQFVWTCVGEGQTQVGRATILSDGDYSYVLTAMAPENKAGALMQGAWQDIFATFRAVDPDTIVSTGS